MSEKSPDSTAVVIAQAAFDKIEKFEVPTPPDTAEIRLKKANELVEQLCETLMPIAMGKVDGADGLTTRKRLDIEGVFSTILAWRGQF